MDWTQAITITGSHIAATLALFIWARKEAADDRRQLTNILIEMKDEMAEFRERMAKLEERGRR